ncbi:MAG TPA: uracil-DNA glycosylase family protein [Xanthomonadaceae bacterium]|nr:uracil-DNA glycosylase family protein [Xanthomonadaceae bacterium]
MKLETLLKRVRACRLCESHLPLGANPILRAGATARLLIVGQAPGTKVHATGIPWNDASGNRLRDWLGMDRETFYDEMVVAIVPMGFCYPGRGKGGDLPPRPECAPTWHPKILPLLPDVRLVLLIGSYAQAAFLGDARRETLTDTVRAAKDYLPRYVPLPHPSPRNQMWLRRNPWFDETIVPLLRRQVAKALVDGSAQKEKRR